MQNCPVKGFLISPSNLSNTKWEQEYVILQKFTKMSPSFLIKKEKNQLNFIGMTKRKIFFNEHEKVWIKIGFFDYKKWLFHRENLISIKNLNKVNSIITLFKLQDPSHQTWECSYIYTSHHRISTKPLKSTKWKVPWFYLVWVI